MKNVFYLFFTILGREIAEMTILSSFINIPKSIVNFVGISKYTNQILK